MRSCAWAVLFIWAQMGKKGLVESYLFWLAATLRGSLSLLLPPSARAQWSLQPAAVAEQLLAGWVPETTVIKRWDGLALSSRSRQTHSMAPFASNNHSVYMAGRTKQDKTQTAPAPVSLLCFSVNHSSRIQATSLLQWTCIHVTLTSCVSLSVLSDLSRTI